MTDHPADYQVLVPLNPGTGSRALLALRRAGEQRAPIVLLPIPKDVLDDSELLLRLEKETARAALLEHPCILRVYGLVETSIGLCRAVEYAHGETLRAVLNRVGHIPLSIATRLTRDVAAGVHYAHLAGNEDGSPLVHGDLRPETIMLSLDGTARVSGYGALTVAPREPLGGRRVVGRRKYVAPEQVLGGRSSMAPPTDVFLLGITLYEMLTGEIPFQQMENPEDAVLEKPLALDRGEIPESLRAVIAKATAKRSRDRFESALCLRLALEEAMGSALAGEEEVQDWIVSLLANDPRYAELSAAIAHALEAPESVAPYVRVPSIPPQPIAATSAAQPPAVDTAPSSEPTATALPQTLPPSPAQAQASAQAAPAVPQPSAPPQAAPQPLPAAVAPAPSPQVQSPPPMPAAAASMPQAMGAVSAPSAAASDLSQLPTQPPMAAMAPPSASNHLATAAGLPHLTSLPAEKTLQERIAHAWPFFAAIAIVAAFLIGQYMSAKAPTAPTPAALVRTDTTEMADDPPAVSPPLAMAPDEAAPADGVRASEVAAGALQAEPEQTGPAPGSERAVEPAAHQKRRAIASAKGTAARRSKERARERQGAPQAKMPVSPEESGEGAESDVAAGHGVESDVEVRMPRARAGAPANRAVDIGSAASADVEPGDLDAELEAALTSASAMERQSARSDAASRSSLRRGQEDAEATEEDEAVPRLHLFTIPQVTARIKGGKTLGRTPLKISMAPGSYTIELIDEPQRIRTERVIAVGERGVSKIDVTLGIGAILVTAPDGASIILDGRRWGVAPLSRPIELYEGRHTLRVTTETDDWERAFDLNADDMLNFNFGSGTYVPRR